MKNRNNIYKWTSILFIIDQITKLIVQKTMNLYDEINLIPNFFSLCYVKNTGAAFSILEDATLFLIIISVIFIILIDKMIKKEEQNLNKLSILSLGMIIGGIFGNLIDRILYRSVIDFISFQFGSYHFPVFNIADIGITVGVLLLVIDLLRGKKHERNIL